MSKFFQEFARYPTVDRRYSSRGIIKIRFSDSNEGDDTISDSYKEKIQCEFDCYCKRVLRQEIKNIRKANKRLSDNEVTYSSLSVAEEAQLAERDEYHCEQTVFIICGTRIVIDNDNLAKALLLLKTDMRDILLMSSFLDMSDYEIAILMGIPRKTVNNRRLSAFNTIVRLMRGGLV